MNILITGGAGFIGSYLVKRHLKSGDSVWVIDDLSAGSLDNLKGLAIRFNQADLRTFRKIDEAVLWSDRIYHMAATVGSKRHQSNLMPTLLNNIHSLEVLLEAVKRTQKTNRMVIASSASVYWHGVAGEQILRENSILKLPSKAGTFFKEVYGFSKYVNEIMSIASGLNCCIARLFNVIGPKQTGLYGAVVPILIHQALKNEPMEILGNGEQTRSFCHVEDIVTAMHLLLEHPQSGREIFNVGNQHLCSVNELAKIIRNLTKSRSEIVHLPYTEFYEKEFQEAQNIKPSFEKLTQTTGFEPKWSLEASIKDIIASET